MINQPPQNNQPMQQQEDEKKKRQGTGFANINRILQANQGAGQRIGQAVGGNISKQAEDVRKGIESGRQQFQAGKQAATQQDGQKIGAANQLVRQQNESEEAYAQRVAQAQNAGQVGQELRATQYSGPMQLQDQDKLQSQAMNVSALSKLAGQGAAGQDVLMRNMVAGRGGYTRGQSALDRLLVGKEGQREMQAGRQAGIGLTAKTGTAIQSAQQQAQAAKQNIEAERERAQQGIMSGATSLQELGQKRAQQFSQDIQDLQKVLAGEDIGDRGRAQDLVNRMQEFGLDPDLMIYGGNATVNTKEMVKNILSNLAEKGQATGLGNYKFDDATRSAGINLAQALADQGREKLFKEEKFDTDAFKNEAEVTQPSEQMRAKDLKAKEYLDQMAKDFASYERSIYEPRMQVAQKYAAVNQKFDALDNASKLKMMEQTGFKRPYVSTGAFQPERLATDEEYFNAFKNKVINPQVSRQQQTADKWKNWAENYNAENPISGMNLFGDGGPSQEEQMFGKLAQSLGQDLNDAPSSGTLGWKDLTDRYGYGAWGDVNLYNDPRVGSVYRDMGIINPVTGQAGRAKTSASIRDAAAKQLGSFQSLRDILMGKLTPTDTNVQEDRTLTQR